MNISVALCSCVYTVTTYEFFGVFQCQEKVIFDKMAAVDSSAWMCRNCECILWKKKMAIVNGSDVTMDF